MKRILSLILCLLALPALAQSPLMATLSQSTTFLNASSISTTKVITAKTGLATYITFAAISAVGANTVKFIYGTGTNCATGSTDLTAAQNINGTTTLSLGNGAAPIIIVPVSVDVCIAVTTGNATAITLSYTQF